MNTLILGGTGTLGKALTREILSRTPHTKITVLSRDEHKQAAMKREFPDVKFVIGDIRDSWSMSRHFENVKTVFHVAALKHVDIMEANPLECYKTNVEGTNNAVMLAQDFGVENFVFSSTDKAVDPINAYGYSKALAEKIVLNSNEGVTKFSVYRWGNVVGSTGSVIPYFAKTLRDEGRAYITHKDMTRFWLPIDWAINFMLHTMRDASGFGAMVPPNMKSARVLDVIDVVAQLCKVKNYKTIETGIRPGEKLHEVMTSQHGIRESMCSKDWARYSRTELIGMLEPIVCL